ncbi:hypothetical protein L209DRAFT_755158 [Thermothelomyces heterothallicus CBS 203.75]
MAMSSCPSDLRALAAGTSRRVYSVYESDRAALLYRALGDPAGLLRHRRASRLGGRLRRQTHVRH